MKRALFVIAALLLVLPAGPAGAASITVDFTKIVTDPTLPDPDITARTNPFGFTLDGVNFVYETFVTTADCEYTPAPDACSYSASIGAGGVFGTGVGLLSLAFATPVTGMTVGFSEFSASGLSQSLDDLGGASFDNGDVRDLHGQLDETGMLEYGLLEYSTTTDMAFLYVTLFFSYEAEGFTIDSLSYVPLEQQEPAPVPEPATLVLLSLGMAGVARRVRKNR